MVHYDEADPNHPGRWQVGLALPVVELSMAGRLGDRNEKIGRENALRARLPCLGLLDSVLVRALWLLG
jgi:hypothetical protein